ncbi:MAG TPA: hypothetical protein PLT43_03875 [Mesotoga sp.]|jgi:hypothetical protein|nr:hypothetical protein [Mesotoga sp.]
MSRVIEWLSFSDVVTGHVENYTVKQFGDLPDDSLSTYTVEDCLRAISKYVTRNMRENRRGHKEAMRDMVKIAHYAAAAFWKMAKHSAAPEIKDIEEGR